MKNLRFFLSAVLALCLAGCSSGSEEEVKQEEDGLLGGGRPQTALYYGDIVTLQSNTFRKYLGADHNSPDLGAQAFIWEKWVIVNAEDPTSTGAVKFKDSVELRSVRFLNYLSADNGQVNLAPSAKAWEKWQIMNATDPSSLAEVKHSDLVFLRSQQFNNYLNFRRRQKYLKY